MSSLIFAAIHELCRFEWIDNFGVLIKNILHSLVCKSIQWLSLLSCYSCCCIWCDWVVPRSLNRWHSDTKRVSHWDGALLIDLVLVFNIGVKSGRFLGLIWIWRRSKYHFCSQHFVKWLRFILSEQHFRALNWVCCSALIFGHECDDLGLAWCIEPVTLGQNLILTALSLVVIILFMAAIEKHFSHIEVVIANLCLTF